MNLSVTTQREETVQKKNLCRLVLFISDSNTCRIRYNEKSREGSGGLGWAGVRGQRDDRESAEDVWGDNVFIILIVITFSLVYTFITCCC